MCFASIMSVRTVAYVHPMAQADVSSPPTDATSAIAPAMWAAAGIALVYVALTAFLGRDILAHLGSTITHDAGDPLLTAAILKWNATHVPLTNEWWQLPIFHPTPD